MEDQQSVSYAATLKDIVSFMNPLEREDLISISLTHVLCMFKKLSKYNIICSLLLYLNSFPSALSGSIEGKKAILQHDEVLVAVFNLVNHKFKEIAKYAALTLINLTADEEDAKKVFEIAKSLNPVRK